MTLVYSNEQLAAIEPTTAAMGDPMAVATAVLTGGPGAGKTSVSREVMRRWATTWGRHAVVALSPTGKAARRFSEVTRFPASTIHRALIPWEVQAQDPPESNPDAEAVIDDDIDDGLDEHIDGDGDRAPASAVAGVPDLWDLRAVLIDEASMIDLELMHRLLAVLPDRVQRLLFVGDADQLPSVGAGSILRDLMSSGKIPSYRLSKLWRQSDHSWIAYNARRVIGGERPIVDPASEDYFEILCDTKAKVRDAVVEISRAHPDAQLMVPTHKHEIGAEALNDLVRETVNPATGRKGWTAGKTVFHRLDRVIHKKNNYKLGVMNGELGVAMKISTIPDSRGRDVERLVVDYDGRPVHYDAKIAADQLRLAFALTVHASQGSEYDEAIVICHSSHSYLLNRSLLYTALTRAKRRVWVIGDEKGIRHAVRNNDPRERTTLLTKRITEAFDRAGSGE